jgi:hypothetical protein
MTDQAGMRAIGIAVAQLSDNPYPPEAFRWGEVLRLRVGPYRIMYTVEGDLMPAQCTSMLWPRKCRCTIATAVKR